MLQTRTFVGVILLLVSCMATAQSQSHTQLSPGDLVKAVIHKGLDSSDVTETHWKYLLVKGVDGKQQTREVIETKSGSLDRMIAMAGKPLTDSPQHDETERILRLSHDPEELRKVEETRERCGTKQSVSPDGS